MPDNVMAIIQEVGGMLGELGDIRVKGGVKEEEKALGEASQAFTWVVTEPLPAKHVSGMEEAMWFWGQKVLVANKNGVNDDKAAWAKAFKAMMLALADYVKANHKTGLEWNFQGADAGSAAASPAATTPAPVKAEKKAAGPAVDMKAGLFAALNKGGDVTQGLNKATKQKAQSGAVSMKKKGHKITKKMGEPKAALEGRKWAVEFQVDNKAIIIKADECNTKQSVNIYRCIGCVIQVQGKVNAILMDDCEKTAVVCNEGCVSSVDVVNCKSVEVQIDKNAPTLLVDKTDGLQIYLQKDSMALNIITSKSSEVNVSVPGATEDDDANESALPEQFCSVHKDGKWITNSMVHE